MVGTCDGNVCYDFNTSAETQKWRALVLSFGERLRELRIERGLSQMDLTGPSVSRSLVSQLERGHAEPSPQALQTLSEKLGVSYEFLRGNVSGPLERTCRTLLKHSWKAIERSHADEAFELSDQAVSTAESLGDRGLISQAQLVRGWASIVNGLPSKGLEDVSESISRYVKPVGVEPYRALQAMAMASLYNDHYSVAEPFFKAILEMVPPRSVERGIALLHLGSVLQARYGPSAGHEEFSEMKELGGTIGDRRIEAWGISGCLSIDIHEGNSVSEHSWKRLADILVNRDKAMDEISLDLLKAYEHRHQGNYSRALDILNSLREPGKEQRSNIWDVSYELARNYMHLGKYDLAASATTQGLQKEPMVRGGYLSLRLLITRAQIDFLKGKHKEALDQLISLLPLARVMSLDFYGNLINKLITTWSAEPSPDMRLET